MKTSEFFSKITILFFCLFVFSCNKDLKLETANPQTIASLDENGGTWKPMVLASPADVTVAAPKDVTSTEYLAEIQEVKQLQSNLTDEQRQAVNYWGAGGVMRWNEIARELAAVYNLPPQFDPNTNSYPFPSVANPKQYPRFPFANPPYAARIFAYLSVVQYDAMVAVWKYKYQFNRKAAYANEASVQNLLPANELPAYPSEAAVIAAASRELLKALFPGEVEMLNAKALEHQNTGLWAGVNVRSDIAAGEELGKAVATKVLARFKTDNMANSTGGANNQAAVPDLRKKAEALNLGTVWQSLESPQRPPMLPTYSGVKTWNFGDAERDALRPVPPPAVGSPEFNQALDELRGFSKKLTREQQRIASYWSDGPGSYTPPGHWNRIAADLAYKNKMNELRFARTLALTNTALMDAGVCCWDVKYLYFTPRPSQVDNSIKTVIGVPNFPSYTSGHSTFSGAAAAVLSYVFPSETDNLNAKAKEASESRIYGCIHYRFDCEAGLKCGTNIGNYAIARGKADNSQ
jgi:hypothetical protein